MNDEQGKQDEELPPASTIEEMRLKRLAYFSPQNTHHQTNEWKIEHPPSTKSPRQSLKTEDKNDLDVLNNETDPMTQGQGISHQYPFSINQNTSSSSSLLNTKHFNMQYRPPMPDAPLYSSQLPYQNQGNSEISEDGPVPLKSKRTINRSNNNSSVTHGMGHLSISDSNDIEGMSVFKSRASLDDLGLSTHRPESEVSARSIQGEIYIPSNQGSGKTTRQIFSHKTQEDLYSALGDEKMEELMNKVSHDIGELKQGRNNARGPFGNQVFESQQGRSHDRVNQSLMKQLSQDSLNEMYKKEYSNGRPSRYNENSSPRRHSLTPSVGGSQEGMKDFRSLFAQNHDQISLPKSARNSFSSEEIYRQAYGDGMMFERNSRGFPSTNSQWPSRQPNRMNDPTSSQNDAQYSSLNSGRSSGMDYSSHGSVRNSPYQGYHNPFSYPPPSVPTSHFDHHHPPPNSAVPISPQSSYAGNGFPYFMQPPPYSGHNNHSQYPTPSGHNNHSQYPPPFYHDHPSANSHQYGHNVYNPLQSQLRASGTPPSPGMYPLHHSYPSPHYGLPRFPGHPVIHQSNFPAQQHAFEQQDDKGNFHPYGQIPHGLDQSLDYNASQNSSGAKIPHPPTNPPALIGKDDSQGTKTKLALEHRRVTVPSSQPAGPSSGEEFNSFNLQRYFSSMELHTDDNDPVSTPVPQSSRSVEGDYYKHDAEDDNATAFTSVTGVTSASKAAGLTSRLADLGVDMDHLKHLKLVDGAKNEVENQDISFDAYAKSIRRCPECKTANKAYMDWCVDCGEVLIGVELSLPRGKKKSNGNSSTENKKNRSRSRSGTRDGKNVGSHSNIDRPFRRESPESGKGISLSSSPARHNKMEPDEGLEPKDSGRDSNGEGKDQFLDLPAKTGDIEKEGENLNEEQEIYDNDDVEYVYEDVESNIFEQISDPILRDFIISYRNRQVKDENSALIDNIDTDNQPFEKKEELLGRKSQFVNDDNIYVAQGNDYDSYSKKAGNYNELRQYEDVNQDREVSERSDGLQYRNKTKGEMKKSEMNIKTPATSLGMPDVKKKKKKKKRKPGSEAIDIEIFGYEESRLSRDFNRGCNIVPALNLANSSDEEESDNEEEDEKVSKDLDVKSSVSTDSSSFTKIADGGSHQNLSKKIQPGSRHPQPLPSKSQAPSQLRQSASVQSQSKSITKSKEDNPSSSTSSNYQRHWVRSSIAWSSYNPRELNTRSSLSNLPVNKNGERPTSARASVNREKVSGANQVNNNNGNNAQRQRPSSADYERRKPVFSQTGGARPSSAKTRKDNSPAGQNSPSPVPAPRRNNYVATMSGPGRKPRDQSPVIGQKNTKDTSSLSTPSQPTPTLSEETASSQDVRNNGGAAAVKSGNEDESLKILCPEFHRLPQDHEEETADKMHAVAKSGYDRFHELTPRIQDGGLSLWQCLPDEVWLFILTFLPQPDLCRLMQVSKGFYRLANDESLWRYITVRPHFALTDMALASIMCHHPVSLAMVKCQGYDLSTNALQDFFRETKGRLKELNICGCSHGALVGSVVLDTASKFCHSLTHLDASYCNINDTSFTAIVSHCDRLESVCINGFQSMSDTALMTLVKKHGTSLRTLELYACFSLTASVLRNLGEYCNNLRRLCLGGCNKLTASTMITLSTNLPRVEELDLRGCRNLKNECIRKIVRNCPRIQTLVLANCQQISNAALVEMGTYLKHTLRVVDVCGCNLVGDQGIISLVKNCDRLTSLDISSTGCTQHSVSAIASSNCSCWIESVKLSFLSGISEASLTNLLRHCPRLKLIHAFGCSSLRNLTRLRDIRQGVTIEGDVEVPRHSFH